MTSRCAEVELGIHPFSEEFRRKHHEVVLQHNKMALAYLDMRDNRTAMNLLEVGEPATQSSKSRKKTPRCGSFRSW